MAHIITQNFLKLMLIFLKNAMMNVLDYFMHNNYFIENN